MARLIICKLILMLIILAILNYVAYHYAILHPRLLDFPWAAGSAEREAGTLPYPQYAAGLFRGDLGRVAGTPVAALIGEPIRNSLILLGAALAVTISFGLLFGFIAVSPHTRRIRPGAQVFLAAGSSLPGFVFGALVLSLLVYQLLATASRAPLLPISGFGVDRHLILPALVLAVQPTFHLAKVTAGLLENELQQDYFLVARSKGLTWSLLLRRHAWANMLAPVLVTMGESMRLMVGELVIVEAIFLWPGIGRFFLFAIGLRLDARPPGAFFGNPYLIASLAVLMGFLLLTADLVANVLAYRLDPRLSHAVENTRPLSA